MYLSLSFFFLKKLSQTRIISLKVEITLVQSSLRVNFGISDILIVEYNKIYIRDILQLKSLFLNFRFNLKTKSCINM